MAIGWRIVLAAAPFVFAALVLLFSWLFTGFYKNCTNEDIVDGDEENKEGVVKTDTTCRTKNRRNLVVSIRISRPSYVNSCQTCIAAGELQESCSNCSLKSFNKN